MSIRIFITGGTFDKEYNELNNIVRIREKQKNQLEGEVKLLKQENENLKNKNDCSGQWITTFAGTINYNTSRLWRIKS